MTIEPRPRCTHRRGLLALAALLALSLFASAVPPAGAATEGRVIVLGFDGADYRTAQEFLDAGRMPNLRRLREQGTFAPLTTTLSPESPVAWAALNSGQDPSKTGIPGFIQREFIGTGADAIPMPTHGFLEMGESDIEDLEPGGPLALFVGRSPSTSAALAFAAVLVFFFLVFRVALRVRTSVSAGFSVLLALIGGAGALRASGYVPRTVSPVVKNPMAVDSFWDVAARAGKRAIVLDAAMSWDRPEVDGARVLAGLGQPDCRGDYGSWFIYTDDEFVTYAPPKGDATDTGGTVFRVDWRDERIETALYGPVDFWSVDRAQQELEELEERHADTSLGYREIEDLYREIRELEQKTLPKLKETRTSCPMTIERLSAEEVLVRVGSDEFTLKEGEWSGWLSPVFELNPLLKVHAVTRVKVLDMDDPFRLFVNVLEVDPRDAAFWQAPSQPRDFSAELAAGIGEPFETVGWACATMGFKDSEIGAQTMMEDVEFTMRWREKLTRYVCEQDDWDVLMTVFSTPDRVQHMMYQFYDPEHPLYDPRKASERMEFFGREIELRDAIPAIFEELDRIIGWMLDDVLGPDDTLLVCADHGFQSFRYEVDINTWLAHEGFLVLKPGVTKDQSRNLMYADWSKTRAYALGMGMIYLNLAGRDPAGIVSVAEAPALMQEIRERMLALRDQREGMGEQVVEEVWVIDEEHKGPYRDREGDLMVGFRPRYRAAWKTTLGDIRLAKSEDGVYVPGDVFRDNKSNWSGGHVSVAPAHVAGIFASNRTIELPAEGAHVLHVAPTVLSLLGIERPAELNEEPLGVR